MIRELLERLRHVFAGDDEAQEILQASTRVPTGLSRRSFLRAALITTAAAAVVDVDQLLWVPGEKTIFLPELAPHEVLSINWITREALRILQQHLTFASSINRRYDASFMDAKVGDTVRLVLPRRFDTVLEDELPRPALAVKNVILDDHFTVALDIPPAGMTRAEYRRRAIEPAMQRMAQHVVEKQIDVVSTLALPPTRPDLGIVAAARGTDPASGLSLRTLQLDAYDVLTDRQIRQLRLDLLGGSTQRPARRRRRRRANIRGRSRHSGA